MSMQVNNNVIQWRVGTDLTYISVDAAKEHLTSTTFAMVNSAATATQTP